MKRGPRCLLGVDKKPSGDMTYLLKYDVIRRRCMIFAEMKERKEK